MAQITVKLTQADKEKLVALAEAEYREPQQQAALLIRRGLGSQAVKWTTEPPTKPGWYWVFAPADDEPDTHFTEVTRFDPLVGPADTLQEIGLLLTEKTHWLGPLPVPAPPAHD